MSTLYRARPKSREDLPEQTRCCEQQIEATLAMGEMVIDLSRTIRESTLCNFCKFKRPVELGVLDMGDAQYVSIAELEIDEKPLEETCNVGQ